MPGAGRTIGAPRQLTIGGDRASWVRDDVLIVPDGAQLVTLHVAGRDDVTAEHAGAADPRCLLCSNPAWRHSVQAHQLQIDSFLEPIR